MTLEINPELEKTYSEIKSNVKDITGFENITLTKRCNESIKIAFEVAKILGKTKCIMTSEGGWITYPQNAEKSKMEIIRLKTTDCKVDLSELESQIDDKSMLIMHSLSGYFYEQPMKEIYEICKRKKCLLVNDCCGSISEKNLICGDVIVCSFGRWKPLNNQSGGFIATNSNQINDILESQLKLKDSLEILTPANIITKISGLQNRVEKINTLSLKIIDELKQIKIKVLNKSHKLNMIVLAEFENEEDKLKIVRVAEKFKLGFEECPRDIRVNRKAISIETKRID